MSPIEARCKALELSIVSRAGTDKAADVLFRAVAYSQFILDGRVAPSASGRVEDRKKAAAKG